MDTRHSVLLSMTGIAVFSIGALTAPGQTGPPDVAEEFDLNIVERRITERDFERSLDADIDANDFRLRVGAGVEARQIDLVLRGVTGRVRFRASLESIRERIARLRSVTNGR